MTAPTTQQQPSTRLLRHEGPCGRREACWRPACREAWPGYRTVEVLPDGEVIARCHGTRFRPVAYRETAA